jgi:hypothetical protein
MRPMRDVTKPRTLRLVQIAELLGVSKQRARPTRVGWPVLGRRGPRLWMAIDRGRRMTDSQAVYPRAGGT